jgi:hypothetical protein
MSDAPRCVGCHHHPHPGRPCRVQRVSGAASAAGRALYGPDPATGKPVLVGYDHGGRTVTPCNCDTYTPNNINGATHE